MKDILYYFGIGLFGIHIIAASIFDNFLSGQFISNMVLAGCVLLVISSYWVKSKYLKLPFLSKNSKIIKNIGNVFIIVSIIMMTIVLFELFVIPKAILNIPLVFGLMCIFVADREKRKLKILNNEH